ncbi:MAG: MMPL family transporter [Proteobacteria bacterium]|nr:MMPL family transporter [Pseudomonadota bacterium]
MSDIRQSNDFKLSFTGTDVMVDTFNRTSDSDMKKFVALTDLTIIIFLLLLLRRISGVVYPLVIVTNATICTIGLMALSQTPISDMTMVVPSFILAVGVADAIHILAIFYKQFDQGSEKEDAICYAMGH